MKLKTGILIFLIIALAHTPCVAGINKTGGGYEIISDTVAKAGMAPAAGGNMILYRTAGRQARSRGSKTLFFMLTKKEQFCCGTESPVLHNGCGLICLDSASTNCQNPLI